MASQPDPGESPSFAQEPEASAPSQDLFGTSLEPALLAACNGRLADLHWFRTDWQRGGAVTGYATWEDETGQPVEVVVKLPVPPQELRWLQRLQVAEPAAVPIVPRLYASGVELGGYDLAWVIMERLRYGPLDGGWEGAEFDLLMEAGARFQARASQFPVDREPPAEDWPKLLDEGRKALRQCALPESQRWNGVLKTFKKKLKTVLGVWEQRGPLSWCHGDLHLANAMTQQPAPAGPAVLFDLARVHVGHWVEDGVYFEHLFWSVPQRLDGRDVVKALSQQRKRLELPVEPEWPRLANIRRILLATGNLAAQSRRPDPAQASAALNRIEQLLPTV